MEYGHLELHIEELLRERGIEFTWKDLFTGETSYRRVAKRTRNQQK